MALIQLQFRADTLADWTAANPVLADGEPAWESDTKRVRIGDGVTPYLDLPYQSSDPEALNAVLQDVLAAATAAEEAADRAESAAGATQPASTTVSGVSRFATLVEAIAGTDDTISVTPVGLVGAIAAVDPAPHQHTVDDIDAAGTKDSTTFLRADGQWAVPPGGGPGGSTTLDGLTDVVAPAPSSGQVLRWNGTEWVNHTPVKADVSLGNVDNTSDANKPVSTATQAALDLKADDADLTTTTTIINDHLADATDAHAASAIGFTPNADIGSTNVQAALVEVRDAVPTTAAELGAATAVHTHVAADITDLVAGTAGPAGYTTIPPLILDTIVAGPGEPFWWNDGDRAVTLKHVRVRSIGGSPSAGTLRIDVNKNDTSMFTNQATRPALGVGATTALDTGIGAPIINPGDYLSVDVDDAATFPGGTQLAVMFTAE